MPKSPIQLPFGTWPSLISPEMMAGSIRLNDVQWAPGQDLLVWSQSHNGKTSLYAQEGLHAPQLLSADLNPAGGMGYGGGDFYAGKSTLVFAERDGRLYHRAYTHGLPRAITPAFGACASPVLSMDENRVYYLHSYEGKDLIATTSLVEDGWPRILRQGADFYMQPALHPQGHFFAWVEWDHPNMPWDGSRLMLAKLSTDGTNLSDVRQLDGGSRVASFQPHFSPDGQYLAWLSNADEWDQLKIYNLNTGQTETLVDGLSLLPPAWVQGLHVSAWAPDSRSLFYFVGEKASLRLAQVQIVNHQSDVIPLPAYTVLEQLSISSTGKIALIAQSSALPARILCLDGELERVVARSQADILPADEYPRAQSFSYLSSDQVSVHGLYYPPTNPRYDCQDLPPLILNIHGGPNTQTLNGFNSEAAFFTSRGYAFFALNYRGSSGYGRSYREALNEHWGQLDVQDAYESAQALVSAGLANPQQLIIKGGSAGGYTVLNSLIHHPGTFKVGLCSYGVSNLFLLEESPEKFEMYSTQALVGRLPEARQKYHDLSPIYHAEKIRDSLAIFQGSADKIVLPEQSESMVAHLRANKVEHIYRLYEGEGHGFRRRETLIDYYLTVEEFLRNRLIYCA